MKIFLLSCLVSLCLWYWIRFGAGTGGVILKPCALIRVWRPTIASLPKVSKQARGCKRQRRPDPRQLVFAFIGQLNNNN